MRLGDLDALKDNMFNYAAPEMMWDRGDIEHKIDEMPTIPAIPVEWIEEHMNAGMAHYAPAACRLLMKAWQEEQEAR